jgi:hypothetical protein
LPRFLFEEIHRIISTKHIVNLTQHKDTHTHTHTPLNAHLFFLWVVGNVAANTHTHTPLNAHLFFLWVVGIVAANRSRQNAVAAGKERRESLVRANVFVDWGLVAMTFLLKRT